MYTLYIHACTYLNAVFHTLPRSLPENASVVAPTPRPNLAPSSPPTHESPEAAGGELYSTSLAALISEDEARLFSHGVGKVIALNISAPFCFCAK